jgi:hypothetical protein
VATHGFVERVDPTHLHVKGRDPVPYGILLWVAGNRSVPLADAGLAGAAKTRRGLSRVLTVVTMIMVMMVMMGVLLLLLLLLLLPAVAAAVRIMQMALSTRMFSRLVTPPTLRTSRCRRRLRLPCRRQSTSCNNSTAEAMVQDRLRLSFRTGGW